MSTGTGTGVANAQEGVQRVRESFGGRPYAFITEGSSADFWVNSPPCEFTSVSVKMMSRSYALATKKNWPTRDLIDNALIRMEQDDELLELQRKWWNTGACAAQSGGTRGTSGDLAATGFRLILQLLAMIVVSGMSTRAMMMSRDRK